MPKPFNPAAFLAKHQAEIDKLGKSLATDFETPAQSRINQAFGNMGEQRFVGADDRWDQVVAHMNGWEYVRPPKHLIARWRAA